MCKKNGEQNSLVMDRNIKPSETLIYHWYVPVRKLVNLVNCKSIAKIYLSLDLYMLVIDI